LRMGSGVFAVTPDGRFVSLRRGPDGWNRSLIRGYAYYDSKAGFEEAKALAIKKYGPWLDREQLNRTREEMANMWLRENAVRYGYSFKEGLI